jgi:pimeloyl-ACP methyl ester carboxylesterase
MLGLDRASGERLASRIGRRRDHLIPDAGHGLQEDRQGPKVDESRGGCSAARSPFR